MRDIPSKLVMLFFLALVSITSFVGPSRAQRADSSASAHIPKTWDDEAVASLEVPLADPRYSPVHVSSDYYYRMSVRQIYKSYPIYAPGKEPPGYMEWLKQQEPEIVFDAAKLKTESDWIRAGELVFNAPIAYQDASSSPFLDRRFYEQAAVPVAKDGTVPFRVYVIRKKGVVEVGGTSCAECHTRVLPGGSIVSGAQGNFPNVQLVAFRGRRRAAQANDQEKQAMLAEMHQSETVRHGAPWMQPDPAERFASVDQTVAALEAVPPGVFVRQGPTVRYAVVVADLIGVKDRHYLDRTGLVRQRSI